MLFPEVSPSYCLPIRAREYSAKTMDSENRVKIDCKVDIWNEVKLSALYKGTDAIPPFPPHCFVTLAFHFYECVMFCPS